MFRSFPNPKTSRNHPKVTLDPPEGSRIEVISPNWCDPTTWYEESESIIGETLSDSGDGLTFNSAHDHWIDCCNGKLTGESLLHDTYHPAIYDNAVEKTESSPGTTDGDFQINYTTGDVTFNQAPTGPVTADYHYENGSTFIVKPTSGKILRLTTVEVQFSENVEIMDTVIFQLYVGGYPYGNPTIYKTMMDYINEASRAYPSIPAMGGASWRGMSQPVHIFQWPYSERGALDLRSSLGMEIRISLENDTEFTGNVAVATFYGISEDE